MLLSHARSLPLSVSERWTRGETVLHRAASLCHRTICHYLVEAGASLMKTDLQVGSYTCVFIWREQHLQTLSALMS